MDAGTHGGRVRWTCGTLHVRGGAPADKSPPTRRALHLPRMSDARTHTPPPLYLVRRADLLRTAVTWTCPLSSARPHVAGSSTAAAAAGDAAEKTEGIGVAKYGSLGHVPPYRSTSNNSIFYGRPME